jgi:hypothetical protein
MAAAEGALAAVAPVAVGRVRVDAVAVAVAGAPGRVRTGDLAKRPTSTYPTNRLHQLVHPVDHSHVDVLANGLNGVWTANAVDPANPCTLRCTQHGGAVVGEQTPT